LTRKPLVARASRKHDGVFSTGERLHALLRTV